MSALSAIAEIPNRVENMFLNSSIGINPSGLYGINMYALGVPHTVLVDDFIPGWTSYSSARFDPIFGRIGD